jgi:hypothetical protein
MGLVGAAAVVAIAASGYGVYAGERARSEQARQYRESVAEARRQRATEEQQMADNEVKQQALYDKQVADQKATEDSLRAQQSAALDKARGEVPGMQAQLGEDLLAQQTHAYERMAPQLEARLNALGLLQSGALPEAQAKYQGDLESQRQAALADFGTSAARELNITRPLADSSEDVGRQYDSLKSNLDLAKTNLSQTFANQNNANLNQSAREQYLAGLASASNAAAQSSANAYLNFGGQVGSGMISAYADKQKKTNPSLDALYAYRQPTYYGSARAGQGAPR